MSPDPVTTGSWILDPQGGSGLRARTSKTSTPCIPHQEFGVPEHLARTDPECNEEEGARMFGVNRGLVPAGRGQRRWGGQGGWAYCIPWWEQRDSGPGQRRTPRSLVFGGARYLVPLVARSCPSHPSAHPKSMFCTMGENWREGVRVLVGAEGFAPPGPGCSRWVAPVRILQEKHSGSLFTPYVSAIVFRGGSRGIRTPDHILKRDLLYQLSYAPTSISD